MISKPAFDIEVLKRQIADRPVYIWAVRHAYAIYRIFTQNSLTVAGFIDSSTSLIGTELYDLPVLLPAKFFAEHLRPDQPRPFVVIASGFYSDEIAEECERNGLKKGADFIDKTDMQCFNYQIDISGMCNLHCISCPRGNMPPQKKTGFMPVATYEQVLDKILREDPFTGVITLYNWGEPLLHPQLPEILRLTHSRGLLTAVSSNLALEKDFTDVIKAKPTWFRLSVSGWGKNYEVTHTGAKWEVFYRNMFRVRELASLYHPDMIIEVFFHIYKHNYPEDFQKIKNLCAELGFLFRYRFAALAPLDNVQAILNNEPGLNDAVLKTQSLQILTTEQVMAIARRDIDKPCHYENYLWINWDLRVANCMEWYNPEMTLADNYLHTPLEQLIAARNRSELCQHCKEQAIHRCFIVYGNEKIIDEALEQLPRE